MTFVLIVLLNAAAPLSLVAGLLRLVRSRGVTEQAVAGALAIYLLVGLLLAGVIGFVAHVDDGAYFAQGTDGSSGDRVYFSFTVVTTTGSATSPPRRRSGTRWRSWRCSSARSIS